MKVTLFTKNNIRHNYLINLLSNVATELYVVQETTTIFPGALRGRYEVSKLMSKYFEKVNDAQIKIFGNIYIETNKNNIKILPMQLGDLNKCSLDFLSDFLKSDLYIVFGSSFIKDKLVDFLINQRTINIHMGISPFYRGTDCNFWALFDNNPHLVGATIHLLSKGLDSGPILYHAVSKIKSNPFEYTMSTVMSAFHSIAERIKSDLIFNISNLEQNKAQEIRYSKKIDFTEKIIESFLSRKINLKSKEFDNTLLKDPFYLDN